MYLNYAAKVAPICAILSALACGPSDGSDGEESAEGNAPDDFSWLIGKYVLGCAPEDMEHSYVHGCSSQFFFEAEFHDDRTMTTAVVQCGIVAGAEPATVQTTDEYGVVSVVPAQGYDFVRLAGGTFDSVEIRRLEDCQRIEASYPDFRGEIQRRYYVRGEFEYIQPSEGCNPDVRAIVRPECPE